MHGCSEQLTDYQVLHAGRASPVYPCVVRVDEIAS